MRWWEKTGFGISSFFLPSHLFYFFSRFFFHFFSHLLMMSILISPLPQQLTDLFIRNLFQFTFIFLIPIYFQRLSFFLSFIPPLNFSLDFYLFLITWALNFLLFSSVYLSLKSALMEREGWNKHSLWYQVFFWSNEVCVLFQVTNKLHLKTVPQKIFWVQN